jgi:zinc/manganese transport system substrate-binding protein
MICEPARDLIPGMRDTFPTTVDLRGQSMMACSAQLASPTPILLEPRRPLGGHATHRRRNGKEYGVDFLSPLGVSTETEASAMDVDKLIDQIKKEKVKVYFIENSSDPRLIKRIADATGAEPPGELYVESLSAAEGPAPTYAKMYRCNVDQIAAAMAKQTAL